MAFSDYKSKNQYHSSYFHNARFMVALKPSKCYKFCCCGVSGCRCKLPLFCSRCAYALALRKWKSYLKNFDKGNFYFLTISFKEDIPFNENNENFSIIWKRIHRIISEIKKKKGIRGALISDEVIVSRFLPLRILPHCHAIIDADDFDQESAAGLSEITQEFIGLPVSLKWRRIPTINDFKSAIGYLYKPMDFHSKYDSAYEDFIDTGIREPYELNNEVYNVLDGIPYILHEQGFSRGTTLGSFHHRFKNSLCIPKIVRERKNQELYEYIQSIDYNTYKFSEDDAMD